MKNFFNRFQVVLTAILLLFTFVLLMTLVVHYNKRWDMTPEKLYSLSPRTLELLKELENGKVEVIAFYPAHDQARENFEMLLKESQLNHPDFQYFFYNPNRRPQLAKYWGVKEFRTVVIRFQDKVERIQVPDEESFATALLRLAKPREIMLCFVREPGDLRFESDGTEGFTSLLQVVKQRGFQIQKISTEYKALPQNCDVAIVSGPQSNWTDEEMKFLNAEVRKGMPLFFMIDPMDPGMGAGFKQFLESYGVRLGDDVVVDKMSRMVGGDFLLPFVNQYDLGHPITQNFSEASFYPVSRSVNPIKSEDVAYQVTGLAYSGSNSWAETSLQKLENGEAVFDAEEDLPGPIPLIVAIESEEKEGAPPVRMIVAGDSDFLSNGYLEISGNQGIVLEILRWLARDDRKVTFDDHLPKFQPLLLEDKQRWQMLIMLLGVYPFTFLILGFLYHWMRKRVS